MAWPTKRVSTAVGRLISGSDNAQLCLAGNAASYAAIPGVCETIGNRQIQVATKEKIKGYLGYSISVFAICSDTNANRDGCGIVFSNRSDQRYRDKKETVRGYIESIPND